MHKFARIAALLVAIPSAAVAHAQLTSAVPAVGSTIHAPPTQVAIHFSEGVEPAFCTVEVRDSAGNQVDTGDPHTAPDDNKELIVGLKPLQPGTYKVTWHATSVDTHKTQGSFDFTLSP